MAKKYQAELKSPLSTAHEDYLKAIYLLLRNQTRVTNSALADFVSVAPASATKMVKKLAEMGLVEHVPYRGITLTALGRKVALEVLRHHRLLELFLHETLEMSWDRVHEEAEKLEHVISEALEDAISSALGDPSIDPHGDPIPSKEGHIAQIPGIPLSKAQVGRDYRLVRVLVQESDRLLYLGRLGLYPDARIALIERAPFRGPLLIHVNGSPHALAHDMASALQVAAIE